MYEIHFGNKGNTRSRIVYRPNDSVIAGSYFMQFMNTPNITNLWAGDNFAYVTGLVVAENTLDNWINTNPFEGKDIKVYTGFSETGEIYLEGKVHLFSFY